MEGESFNLKCPYCGDQIVKSYENEVKMRLKLLKWNSDGLFAVCKGCKSDVPIDFSVLKSIDTRFVYEIKEKKICSLK